MTERIGVTYLNLPFPNEGAHLALFYEKANGEKTVIEFGPTIPNPALSEQAKQLATDVGAIAPSGPSPFGLLKGAERAWNDNPPFRDSARPSETLITGSDLFMRNGTAWGGDLARRVARAGCGKRVACSFRSPLTPAKAGAHSVEDARKRA
jgi:hypothetical protein